jgi:hypothetical protein
MTKKSDADKLTGAQIRIPLKPEDKKLIEEAARLEDARGEVAGWCRPILVEAARKAVRKRRG